MHHHGTVIRRCRPDAYPSAGTAGRMVRASASQRNAMMHACAWVRIPVSPGKNLSKMISQIRSNLNSAHLDVIYIYIYVCVCVYIYIYTKILEVNLFAFAYRLFRRDFSPLDGTYCMGTHSWGEISTKQSVGKCKQINF